MGDVADMMLDGTLCESCGTLLIDEHTEPEGFPVLCHSCAEDHPIEDEVDTEVDIYRLALGTKIECPFCKRWIKAIGYSDHFRDKHLEAP